MCTTCMTGTHEDQKKASDSLELKLQVIVSHHMDSEKQVWVFHKNSLLTTGSSYFPRPHKHLDFAKYFGNTLA